MEHLIAVDPVICFGNISNSIELFVENNFLFIKNKFLQNIDL